MTLFLHAYRVKCYTFSIVSVLRNIRFQFRPRLLDDLKGYDRHAFSQDLSAGITVGVVALPLAMAFAIASGLPPQAGLFTAIIAGLLISALGGSSVQIGGPAGAFIVVVFGIVAQYGLQNLLIATICAGALMILMGLFRWGGLVRLIPHSIVVGFTNGIAVLIALSQVRDFFGLHIPTVPPGFVAKMEAILGAAHTVEPIALLIALVSLAIVVFWPKSYAGHHTQIGRAMARLPGTLVALILGTVAVGSFGLPVATIGSAFGDIPQGLPSMSIPTIDWETVRYLFAPILTIAFLGAVESLLCARVADAMTKTQHDPNQELIAQGVANIASPLFGGFCATGTVARTVTNIRAGAKTPIAGIIHAVTLLAVMIGAAPLAKNVPLATLAGILMFVAWNMGEWRAFLEFKKVSLGYRIILLTTFILTIAVDVTAAVGVGLILAYFLSIVRRTDQL